MKLPLPTRLQTVVLNAEKKMTDCWICGDIANSKEHKFKASDIKRVLGKKFDAYYVQENVTQIKSYKNRVLKFPEIICEECNVKRTRAHDDAYDIFINYCISNYQLLLEKAEINFENIYGQNWNKNKRNLYRYFAKHAGCRIMTCETAKEYPQNLKELSDFILGAPESTNFVLKFELKQVIKIIIDTKKKIENRNYGHLFNMTIFPFGNINNLNFGSWLSNNWITINWVVSNSINKVKIPKFDRKTEPLDIISCDYYNFEGIDEFVDLLTYSDIGTLNDNKRKLEHYLNIIK